MAPFVYDVVIIGGGLAGSSTALALKNSNPSASTLVIDDAIVQNFKIGESLPPESSHLLHLLDPSLPTQLSNQYANGHNVHLQSAGNASAWASPDIEENPSIMNPFGAGYHLDRVAFDQLLRDTVMSKKRGIDAASDYQGGGASSQYLVKGRVVHANKSPSGAWEIMTMLDPDTPSSAAGTETVFQASWIVDATGRKATIASKLGAKIVKPDPLLAFYAIFSASTFAHGLERDQDHRTLIEAVPQGWFYTSQVPSSSPEYTTTRVVVFHTSPSHAAAKSTRRLEGFLELLKNETKHVSALLATHGYEVSSDPSHAGGGTGGRGAFPIATAAGTSYLDAFDFGEKWIAVGDAAMAFDPLSSQGMMTALEMGYCVGTLLGARLLPNTVKDPIADLAGPADSNLGRSARSFDWSMEESGLGQVYQSVKDEYTKHRAYYYSLGKTRFPTDAFWQSV